jgi:uncharacterized protein (TIGR00369 family)
MEYVREQGSKLWVRLRISEHILQDTQAGCVHGGAITATLDNACGWSIRAHSQYEDVTSMATLNLRVDFIRPAVPEMDIMVMAECYAIQQNMAYVKAVAYQTSMNDPVAKSLTTFTLDTLNTTRTIE